MCRFGGKWGLCGVVILCREGWLHGSSQITLGFLVTDKYETDEVCEPSTSPELSARQRVTGEKRAHVHRKSKTSRVEIVGQIMQLQANQQQVNPLMHKVAKMVT